MPNAYTQPADVFKPQVLGEMIRAYLFNNVALIGSGHVGELSGAIWNAGGDTVTFRTFAGFSGGSSATPVDGTKIDSQKVTMSSYTKAVVNRMISIAVNKLSIEDVSQDTDLFNEIFVQIGEQVRKDIDLALVTEAETTSLSHTVAGTISYTATVAAKMKWADKTQSADPALIVHSKVYEDLLKLAEVSTYNNWGPNPTVQTGAVPYFCGMPVFVSNNITTVTGTPNTFRNLILDRGSLQFGLKREVEAEIKTEPGTTMRYIDVDYRYVTHLRQTNPLGTIRFITQ